jgi:transposase-like protein
LLKNRADCPPETINTDQNEAYGKAIRQLKTEGRIEADVQHRQVKYLNNRLEGDHAALKRVIRPMRGFKSMPTAYAAIKGIEVMRMIRKGNCVMLDPGVAGEVRFVNRLFYLPA